MNEKSCKDCDNRTMFYYCNEFRVSCSIQRKYNLRCKKHWQRKTLKEKFTRLLKGNKMWLKHTILLLFNKRYRLFRMSYELANKYQGLAYNYKDVYNDWKIINKKKCNTCEKKMIF